MWSLCICNVPSLRAKGCSWDQGEVCVSADSRPHCVALVGNGGAHHRTHVILKQHMLTQKVGSEVRAFIFNGLERMNDFAATVHVMAWIYLEISSGAVCDAGCRKYLQQKANGTHVTFKCLFGPQRPCRNFFGHNSCLVIGSLLQRAHLYP